MSVSETPEGPDNPVKKPDAGKADGDDTASSAASSSVDGAINPPIRRRGRGFLAFALAAIFLGGPALFLLCAWQSGAPARITATTTGEAVSCPSIAGHFTDCYLVEEATVSALPAPEKPALERFCCDYIVTRGATVTASYKSIPGKSTPGALPFAPDDESAALALNDGFRHASAPVLFSGTEEQRRIFTLRSTPEITVPALDKLSEFLGQPLPIDPLPLLARIFPPASGPVRHEVPLTDGGTVLRIDGDIGAAAEISFHARTLPSLLVADLLTGTPPADILHTALLPALPANGSGSFLTRIEQAAPGAQRRAFRTAWQALAGQQTSRLAVSEGAQAVLLEAGRACITFYGMMRGSFSTYDAAVATYIAARPTGLLTTLSPADLHGCRDAERPELSRAITADWAALNAPFTRPVIPETTAPESTETAEISASNEARNNGESNNGESNDGALDAAVRKLLVDLASAAKSGARLQDLEASISPSIAARFGHDGARITGSREALVRMLHRQWSHVGCWLHVATPEAGGSAMLLAEAQYPYLNRIVLAFDENGQVTGLEVTGVIFDDLLRFRALNRGQSCRRFLNRPRLTDYRDWFASNPPGAPTPADHAERLFHNGPGLRFRLN